MAKQSAGQLFRDAVAQEKAITSGWNHQCQSCTFGKTCRL